MAVYIAAAAAFLYYFCAIPVKLALSLRICAQTALGTGASVFDGSYALKSARMRARGEKKPFSRKPPKLNLQKRAALQAAIAAGWHLLKHLRLESLCAEGRISLQDAAHTALVCGCARSLEGALLPCTPRGAVRFRLEPDFSDGQSDVLLCGMVSVRVGHIILAALIGAWNFIIRSISHGKASD